MSFALSPFATHPFGTTAQTGPMTSSGIGISAGTATAAAVADLWGSVIFQADFDPVNPAGLITSPVIDYKGHTVLKGNYPRVTPDIGNLYNSTGDGHLRGGAGSGNIAYVDGLSSEFNDFRLTNKWTLEFRLLVSPGWFGYVLSIQASTGGSPLTVFVDTDGSTFGILVKPQNQITAYSTGKVYTAEAYTWHSFIVECNGSTVKIVHDTIQASTTTDTSLSYNSAVANSLTLLGLSKDHSGAPLYLDELRITKAARYGGTGYPASPWPYYNGREGWSFAGSSTGTSTAAAEGAGGSVYTETVVEAVGNSAGSSTLKAVFLPVPSGKCYAHSTAVATGRGVAISVGSGVGASTAVAALHGGDTAYGSCQSVSSAAAVSENVPTRAAAGLSESSVIVLGRGSAHMAASAGAGTCTSSATVFGGSQAIHQAVGKLFGRASSVGVPNMLHPSIGASHGKSSAMSWVRAADHGVAVLQRQIPLTHMTKVENVFVQR